MKPDGWNCIRPRKWRGRVQFSTFQSHGKPPGFQRGRKCQSKQMAFDRSTSGRKRRFVGSPWLFQQVVRRATTRHHRWFAGKQFPGDCWVAPWNHEIVPQHEFDWKLCPLRFGFQENVGETSVQAQSGLPLRVSVRRPPFPSGQCPCQIMAAMLQATTGCIRNAAAFHLGVNGGKQLNVWVEPARLFRGGFRLGLQD